jgi:hypothetical protein
MAIRMAEDLGLNRVADHWKYKGNDLFTPDEKQMRKVVWFGCYIVDVFISVYLGKLQFVPRIIASLNAISRST